MNISFDRNRVQTIYESFIGIGSPEDFQNKEVRDRFKSKILSNEEKSLIVSALCLDAKDYLYNGILCLAEGISNASVRRYSWATVQLYYSIYYLLRSSMAIKGIAILRCKSMYRLMTYTKNVSPIGSNNKKYNTTHEGTINHYRDLFSDSDYLETNTIDGDNSYDWMKEAREIVNYKSRSFAEPYCLSFWDYYDSCVTDGTLNKEILALTIDDTKCFQSDFAIIAIPLKRYVLTKIDYLKSFPSEKISEERSDYIKKAMYAIPDLLDIFEDLLS